MRIRPNSSDFPKPLRADNRDGIGWTREQVNRYVATHWEEGIIGIHNGVRQSGEHDEGTMADTAERFDQATRQIEEAYEKFDAARKKLKSELKNDSASVIAASEKVYTEMIRVYGRVESVAQAFTDPKMLEAIANAERLATALASIQALNSHKLTFAVIDNKVKNESEARE